MLREPEGLADSSCPMLTHDSQHTGRSPYLGAQTAELKWRYETEGSIWSSPAIGSDGTMYIGGIDTYLYAFGRPVIERGNSNITCVLPSSQTTAGESVTVTGRISPPISSTVRILHSTDGVTWNVLTKVRSGYDGSYSYMWSSIYPRKYYFKASWLGDRYYLAAISNTVPLTVNPSILEQALP
ncbi:MAG: PQQ-binding-like beta-propeller repeat protein [Thermoproteota archaeon]